MERICRGIKMNYEKYIDRDIMGKYEFYNYGHALENYMDG